MQVGSWQYVLSAVATGACVAVGLAGCSGGGDRVSVPDRITAEDLAVIDIFVDPRQPGDVVATRRALESSPAVEWVAAVEGPWRLGIDCRELRTGFAVQLAVDEPGNQLPTVLKDIGRRAVVFRSRSSTSGYSTTEKSSVVPSERNLPARRAQGVDAEVFLNVGIDASSRGRVERTLRSDRALESVASVSAADRWQRFQEVMWTKPDIVDSMDLKVLPLSFEVDLVPNANVKEVIARIERIDGVEQVNEVPPPWRLSRTRPSPMDLAPEVFFAPNTRRAHIDSAIARLHADDRVESFDHLDKVDALAEFRRLFAGDPELVIATGKEQLPESIRVTVRVPATRDELVREMNRWPGVTVVNDPPSDAEKCEAARGE